MNYDLFENEKDKAAARQSLVGFTDLPAWKLIEKALDVNIAHLQNQLRTRKDFVSTEEVFYLQDTIFDLQAFKDLPNTLLQAAQPEEEEPEEEEIY